MKKYLLLLIPIIIISCTNEIPKPVSSYSPPTKTKIYPREKIDADYMQSLIYSWGDSNQSNYKTKIDTLISEFNDDYFNKELKENSIDITPELKQKIIDTFNAIKKEENFETATEMFRNFIKMLSYEVIKYREAKLNFKYPDNTIKEIDNDINKLFVPNV